MRNALPVMADDVAPLRQRLPHERDGRKNPRLQMRSWLASGPAQTRQDVARLLGVHRHPSGHWLALYAAGGLAALREVYVPAGKPLSLPPDVLAAIAQALRQPAGLGADDARRQWVKHAQQLEVTDHTLSTRVRTWFTATLKVPRPRHTKNA